MRKVRKARNYFDSQLSGRTKSIENPAGTMTLYSYQADAFDPQVGLEVANEITTITETGQPDGSKQIQTYTGGRLVSSVLQDSGGGQLGGTTYTYDAHGRLTTATDARNGTSTVTYYVLRLGLKRTPVLEL